jgi:hypothetical protein
MLQSKPLLVVPAYEKYATAREDLENLLLSIKLGEIDKYCRIVVCLDGASRIFETTFKENFPNYEFLNHSGNPKNFTGNSNVGLRIARNEGVGSFLVNMDTILPPWQSLKSLMEGDMVGANTIDLPNKPLEEVISLLEASSKDPTTIPVQELPGWKVPGYCMWYSGALLKEIGLLPEHELRASFDDDFMTALALLAGFKVTKSSVCVYHKGSHIDQAKTKSSLTGSYTDRDLGLHMDKFYRRWSLHPSVPHEHAIEAILGGYTWTPELREEVITV